MLTRAGRQGWLGCANMIGRCGSCLGTAVTDGLSSPRFKSTKPSNCSVVVGLDTCADCISEAGSDVLCHIYSSQTLLVVVIWGNDGLRSISLSLWWKWCWRDRTPYTGVNYLSSRSELPLKIFKNRGMGLFYSKKDRQHRLWYWNDVWWARSVKVLTRRTPYLV